MSPELAASVVGSIGVVGGALVAGAFSLLTDRRNHSQGAATRDTLHTVATRLTTRIDDVRDEMRADLAVVHDDLIDVRGEEGKGTTVSVSIPNLQQQPEFHA